jgi:CubicO group peptidase (beta-lactamase class C family)
MINNIAAPLGMDETKITLDPNMQSHLAVGHQGTAVVENWDIPTLAGAGAIRSSTADMLRFLSANLGYTETTLQPAMEMTHKARHNKVGSMEVGLGWHIREGAAGEVIWHNGGTGGYRAFAGFVKETGKGVVVLTNSTASVDDIGFHLLDPDTPLTAIQSKAEAIAVPEATLARYVGKYELSPDFMIEITREGTRLFGQATGQGRFELFAKNDAEFFLTVLEARITFQANENEVKSLTLFQNGQETIGKRME